MIGRSVFFVTRLLLSLSLLMVMAATSNARDPVFNGADLGGNWNGVVTTTKQGSIAVTLTIGPHQGTTIPYVLHYGPPRNCKVEGNVMPGEQGLSSLKIGETSGGFCDRLWSKAAFSLQRLENNRLRMILDNNPETRQEELGELVRATR